MYDGVFYCAKCLLITSVFTRVVKEQSHSEKLSFISAHLLLKTEFPSEFFTGESHSTDWKISLPKAPEPANTAHVPYGYRSRVVPYRLLSCRMTGYTSKVTRPGETLSWPRWRINVNQSTEDGQKEEMIRRLCEHFYELPLSNFLPNRASLFFLSLSLSFLY